MSLTSLADRFPIVFSSTGEARVTLEAGPTPERVLITSVPKAGTYLLGGLLTRLGMGDTRLHLEVTQVTDYRNANQSQARERPSELKAPLGLETTLPLVGPGQFVVGHLPSLPEVRGFAAGFRIVLAVRDLRDAVVSMMRFIVETGRAPFGSAGASWRQIPTPSERLTAFLDAEGTAYLAGARALAGWMEEDGVLAVRFETLSGDAGQSAQAQCVEAIARHAGLLVSPERAAEALHATLGTQTLTWSGVRTERAAYWSEQAERVFAAIGGVDLNRTFGYD